MSQENKYRAFSDDKIGKNYSEDDLESFPIQQNSTPAELVDALNLVFGKQTYGRAVHAKGIVMRGRFLPS